MPFLGYEYESINHFTKTPFEGEETEKNRQQDNAY